MRWWSRAADETPIILSLLALGLAGVTWLWYVALIPVKRVPVRPVAKAVSVIGAIGLAIFGVVWCTRRSMYGGYRWGLPTGFRELAIPTSILVDEDCIVRWIDRATDYRLRGDRGRSEAALAAVFSAV